MPLITVLFMSSVMRSALFLPDGVNFDKLLRASGSASRSLPPPIWRKWWRASG
ncbi:MAG: hypothetical protein HPM95_15520 [Alphaproteobacteria bacterium]|nr:hypothetical protein [Alphaproteobacteria bacterium]